MSSVLVKDFFDGHAEEYKTKYSRGNKFYEYFFFERLDEATKGIDFKQKAILDVGSGTGPLFDYLHEIGQSDFSKFVATDISEQMLNQSNVPVENRFAGNFAELEFDSKFDLIFMLGVTTYLSPADLKAYFKKVESLLVPGGQFIVTFTNQRSLDIWMRGLLSPLRKLMAGKNRVLAQDFDTWYYTKKEALNHLPQGMTSEQIIGINHTIFPFSRLLSSISISIAKRIYGWKDTGFKLWLSSDFLIRARLQSSPQPSPRERE
ncbi:MAG: class I SAM-dependent methyltransferase [Cyclobacteriaceae bacterium]